MIKKGKAKSRRTVPSACNSQEIKAYILMKDGVYLYDEVEHTLICKIEKDIRNFVGTQKMMKSAPLGIVLVADLAKFTSPYLKGKEAQKFSAWVDTGYLSQNIYLYCTAAGMSTVALGMIDRPKLRGLMEIEEDEKIVLTQVVGYQVQ